MVLFLAKRAYHEIVLSFQLSLQALWRSTYRWCDSLIVFVRSTDWFTFADLTFPWFAILQGLFCFPSWSCASCLAELPLALITCDWLVPYREDLLTQPTFACRSRIHLHIAGLH